MVDVRLLYQTVWRKKETKVVPGATDWIEESGEKSAMLY
jgi:hypothetical protein